MQWENRRAEDSLLVLYTPARMFFDRAGIPGLGQDCTRIVDCDVIGVIVMIVLCVCRCGCVFDLPGSIRSFEFCCWSSGIEFRVEVKVVGDSSQSR